jgi:hypothetical protein
VQTVLFGEQLPEQSGLELGGWQLADVAALREQLAGADAGARTVSGLGTA